MSNIIKMNNNIQLMKIINTIISDTENNNYYVHRTGPFNQLYFKKGIGIFTKGDIIRNGKDPNDYNKYTVSIEDLECYKPGIIDSKQLSIKKAQFYKESTHSFFYDGLYLEDGNSIVSTASRLRY